MLEAVGVEVAATVTAAASLGTTGAALGILRSVRRTERAVFGPDTVDHDDGLLGAVRDHEQRLDDHEAILVSEGYIAIPDGSEEDPVDV